MALVSISQIKTIANKYLNDSSITAAITYKSIAKTFNKATAEVSETETEVSTRALKIKYKLLEIMNSGGAIQEKDRKFIVREKDLSDNSITPKNGDRITISSVDWEILDIEPIEVDDEIIMYEFHCRS